VFVTFLVRFPTFLPFPLYLNTPYNNPSDTKHIVRKCAYYNTIIHRFNEQCNIFLCLHFLKISNTVLIAVFVMAVFNIGKIYFDYNKASTPASNIVVQNVCLSSCGVNGVIIGNL